LKDSKINKELIKKNVAKYIDKIDKLAEFYKGAEDDSYKARKTEEMADDLWNEIKKQRSDGLSDGKSEITNGNVVYKALRRLNYIDKLFSLRDKSYDKKNSLSENNE
jgi:hypothetical protein